MKTEEIQKALALFAAGAWRPNEIVVGNMQYFCEKLDIKRTSPNTQATVLTELYGIRVRENRFFPMNRASLVDDTGKVIRIFEV